MFHVSKICEGGWILELVYEGNFLDGSLGAHGPPHPGPAVSLHWPLGRLQPTGVHMGASGRLRSTLPAAVSALGEPLLPLERTNITPPPPSSSPSASIPPPGSLL